MVVDGLEQKEYDGVGFGTLAFSPDSQTLAYIATRDNKQLVVVNGAEGKEYEGFLEGYEASLENNVIRHRPTGAGKLPPAEITGRSCRSESTSRAEGSSIG